MKKTGLILAGLIGGMVMLGSAPALAEAYTTAPAFVSSGGDELEVDNSRRIEQTNDQRNDQDQDVEVNVLNFGDDGLLGALLEAIGGVLGGGGAG